MTLLNLNTLAVTLGTPLFTGLNPNLEKGDRIGLIAGNEASTTEHSEATAAGKPYFCFRKNRAFAERGGLARCLHKRKPFGPPRSKGTSRPNLFAKI